MCRALFVLAVTAALFCSPLSIEPVGAESGTEFSGTVVSVDEGTGKFAVKKDSGGTRFTFVANEKTQFEGGPKHIKDLKKDDHVVVFYQVQGPQYLALKVALKGK
jgi:hypothetical protein